MTMSEPANDSVHELKVTVAGEADGGATESNFRKFRERSSTAIAIALESAAEASPWPFG
jgi:hypothetical protein